MTAPAHPLSKQTWTGADTGRTCHPRPCMAGNIAKLAGTSSTPKACAKPQLGCSGCCRWWEAKYGPHPCLLDGQQLHCAANTTQRGRRKTLPSRSLRHELGGAHVGAVLLEVLHQPRQERVTAPIEPLLQSPCYTLPYRVSIAAADVIAALHPGCVVQATTMTQCRRGLLI